MTSAMLQIKVQANKNHQHLRDCLIKFCFFLVGIVVGSHVVPGDSSEEANPHIFPNSDDSIEKAGTHIIPNSDDFSKEVCPENSSNLGETDEEAVFENTETLTTTSEKVLIEMGFDKGEEELTSSIYWRSLFCQHCQ